MGLYILNNSSLPVDVAFAYSDSSCRSKSGVGWRKTGWFNVAPRSRRQLVSGYVGGSSFFVYAENVNGDNWGGDFYTQVPDDAFSWCWNTGCSTCTNVGFGRVSVGIFTFHHIIEISADNTIKHKSIRIKSHAKLKKGYRVGKLTAIPRKRKLKKSKIIKRNK